MEKSITPHQSMIERKDREKLSGHKSVIIWFTGLSGSGKSTLACRLEHALFHCGIRTYILDGDNIRKALNKDLGFSKEDRTENIRRVGEIARLFLDSGVVVLTAFISPYRNDRDFVRNLMQKGEFIEVYVKCPLETCKKRDVKGLYNKAEHGELQQFTGIDDPYEEPQHAELTIDTESMDVEQCIDTIIGFLERNKILTLSRTAMNPVL